jgi:outer membrane protein TolC
MTRQLSDKGCFRGASFDRNALIRICRLESLARALLGCFAVAVVFTSGSGCIRYRPLPIEPPLLETQYRSRTVADPGLREFIQANAPNKITEWPPRVLDLEALSLIAVYFSPDLDVARSQVAIAQAGMIRAGTRVNPTIDTEAGYNANPESHKLFSLLPKFMIETAGKRGLRIVEAQKRLQAARLALAEEGWRVHSRVRRAFYDYQLATRARDLLRVEESIRAEIVDIFDKRLAVGEAARPEYDVFRVDLINTRAGLRKSEGEVARTLAGLATAAGLPAAAVKDLVIDTPTLESPPGEGALPLAAVQRAGLLHRIDVQRMLTEYAAAEAAVQLEVARQYPNIELGPGYVFEEGFNRYVLAASMPSVPLFHRNRGLIAEAEARRQRVERQFIALQAAAIGELEEAMAQYRAALVEFEETGRMVGVERSREAAARRALVVGEGDRLGLATARLQTVTAERARLDALMRVRTALGALEDAVQHPLENGLVVRQPSETSPRKGENR